MELACKRIGPNVMVYGVKIAPSKPVVPRLTINLPHSVQLPTKAEVAGWLPVHLAYPCLSEQREIGVVLISLDPDERAEALSSFVMSLFNPHSRTLDAILGSYQMNRTAKSGYFYSLPKGRIPLDAITGEELNAADIQNLPWRELFSRGILDTGLGLFDRRDYPFEAISSEIRGLIGSEGKNTPLFLRMVIPASGNELFQLPDLSEGKSTLTEFPFAWGDFSDLPQLDSPSLPDLARPQVQVEEITARSILPGEWKSLPTTFSSLPGEIDELMSLFVGGLKGSRRSRQVGSLKGILGTLFVEDLILSSLLLMRNSSPGRLRGLSVVLRNEWVSRHEDEVGKEEAENEAVRWIFQGVMGHSDMKEMAREVARGLLWKIDSAKVAAYANEFGKVIFLPSAQPDGSCLWPKEEIMLVLAQIIRLAWALHPTVALKVQNNLLDAAAHYASPNIRLESFSAIMHGTAAIHISRTRQSAFDFISKSYPGLKMEILVAIANSLSVIDSKSFLLDFKGDNGIALTWAEYHQQVKIAPEKSRARIADNLRIFVDD